LPGQGGEALGAEALLWGGLLGRRWVLGLDLLLDWSFLRGRRSLGRGSSLWGWSLSGGNELRSERLDNGAGIEVVSAGLIRHVGGGLGRDVSHQTSEGRGRRLGRHEEPRQGARLHSGSRGQHRLRSAHRRVRR